MAKRNKTTAVLLALLLGGFGGHRFYLNKKVSGIVRIGVFLLAVFFMVSGIAVESYGSLFFGILLMIIPSLLSTIELIHLLRMDNETFSLRYNNSSELKYHLERLGIAQEVENSPVFYRQKAYYFGLTSKKMLLNSESGRIYEISNSSKQNKDKKQNYYFVFSGKTDEDTIIASHDGALPLWTPFEVKDNREERLGTIEWDGGPVKGGWLLKREGVKELRFKEELGVMRYIGKLIITLLPGKFYTTHTRNMYLFDSDEKLYGFLLHKGTWFNPSYEFVYTREAEELFGMKLLYALCGLNAVANT